MLVVIMVLVFNLWNACESCSFLATLNVILQASEDERPHHHKHHKQAQILPACAHRVSNRLEAHAASCQLKNPHNPCDPEHLHDFPQGSKLNGFAPRGCDEEQVQIVRHYC